MLELVAELGEDLGSSRVVGPPAAGFAIAHSGVDEGLEMVTHRGLGQAEVMFQVKYADSSFSNSQEMEDLDALGITQGLANCG